MDGEQFAVLIGGVDHSLKVGGRNSDRLFTDDIFSSCQRLHCDFPMYIVWCGDSDNIDSGIRQKLLQRIIGADALISSCLLTLFLNVEDTGQISYIALQ